MKGKDFRFQIFALIPAIIFIVCVLALAQVFGELSIMSVPGVLLVILSFCTAPIVLIQIVGNYARLFVNKE